MSISKTQLIKKTAPAIPAGAAWCPCFSGLLFAVSVLLLAVLLHLIQTGLFSKFRLGHPGPFRGFLNRDQLIFNQTG